MDKRILEEKLDALSTYGLMAGFSQQEVREIIVLLRDRGFLRYDKDEIVALTGAASGILFRGERVEVTLGKEQMQEKFPMSGTVGVDSKLLTALKALRTRLAQEANIPAYVIFSNATLNDMALKAPRNMKEFLTVDGVGEIKAQRYGKAFLNIIRKETGG